MTNAAITLHRSTGHRPRMSNAGFTYMALLAAIVIIGISLGAAGKYWQNVMMREKEEELLFRGDQYRTAIERYYFAIPGRFQFPQNIEDLLKDDRTATGKRHLRRQFRDPVTNEEFEIVRDQAKGNRIVGVHSKSDKEPVRKTGFPDQYLSFEGKLMYSEWKFLFMPLPGQPGMPPPGAAHPGQTRLPTGTILPGQPGFPTVPK